ncbi:uncharacterized protein N7469_002076 [Penicillium citrinum]|uniref:Nephrocystin 3-like N-terminal domain-containing protein n=1 Tax=Penicillium citrinum TaxID=5077 RepID=A0A9W9P9T8_PENCI|nr:uncharacterized protein N7469_002076 [Penicillium citrinum]KAJ5240485.1 hypothetical protein N7469_002076 [Penicillium citrinum]
MFDRLKQKLRRHGSKKNAKKDTEPHPANSNGKDHPPPATLPVEAPVGAPVDPASGKGSANTPDAPKDLWLRALGSLPESRQEKLKEMGFDPSGANSESTENSINDLVSIVNKRQEECESKFWKVKLGDEEIVLRDYTDKIVDWVGKAGDIAVQFAPPQAAIPWAVIKSVMQVPVIEGEQMAALLATTEKVVSVIGRGQVYESVYLKNTPADTLSKNLESALTAIYKTALDLLYESGSLFAQSTPKRVVQALLNPGHVSEGLEGIGRQEDDLLRTVSACEIRRSDNADNSIIEKIDALGIPIRRLDEGIQHLLQQMGQKEHIEMLEWISPVPFGKNHDHAKKNKAPGTCEWILDDSKFVNWMQGDSSIFWAQGSPGTGKTYLTSTVVDHIQSQLGTSRKNEGFAFFYCDKNEPQRSQSLSILQSIVRQLSTTAQHPGSAQIKLHELYMKCRDAGSHLDLDQCKNQIQASSVIYERTTIVIDALDECDSGSRYELIDVIDYLTSQPTRPVKVFISSRPNPEILNQFEKTPDIDINASLNKSDIQKFLETELNKLSKRIPFFRHLKEEIVNELLRRCDGMFQWTFLQLHQIQTCRSDAAVRDRLKTLPKDLYEAYDELWSQIEDFEEPDRILVHRAMLWVIVAENPWSISDLLCAIRVNTTAETPSLAGEIDEEGLLSLCKNFLTIDSNQKVWRFSHLSVREYLEVKLKWTLPRANFHAASACLSWFITMYDEGNYENVNTRIEKQAEPSDISHVVHPFHLYMRHRWPQHVQGAQDDQESTLSSLLKTFLGSPKESSQQYQKWYGLTELDPIIRIQELSFLSSDDEFDTYQSEYHPVRNFFSRSGIRDSFQHFGFDEKREIAQDAAVHAMCYYSFSTILSDWWQNGDYDITQKNNKGNDVLAISALVGCTEICNMIVERGMDVNFQINGEPHFNALAVACERGNRNMAKCLGEAVTDISLQKDDPAYVKALMAACEQGYTDIVKCFVEAGADINLQADSPPCGSALIVAAKEGHTDTVKYLVGAGADVNLQTKTGDFGSALVAAAHGGHLESVKFLVESGAMVNIISEGGDFVDALAAARDGERTGTVDYLLNTAGADDSPFKPMRMRVVMKSQSCYSQAIAQTSNSIAVVKIAKKK